MKLRYVKQQIATKGLVARYKLWAGSTDGLVSIFDYSLNGLVGEWIGPNLVTNGTFTGNADNWNLTPGWVYGSNAVTVTADGTELLLTQTGTSLVFGTVYRFKYDISDSDMDGSGLRLKGSGAFGAQALDHTNGTHIYYLPKTNASPAQDVRFFIHSDSTPGKVLTIDNIVVSEIASPPPDGRGIIFDGTDSHIDIGTGPSSVKTVLLWVKPTDVAGNDYPIDLNGTDFLSIETGTLTKNGFAGGTTVLYTDGVAASTITANWHLVGITNTVAKNATDFDIGKETANFFDGTIGEVFLFDRVLSPADVKSIYELTRWRYSV